MTRRHVVHADSSPFDDGIVLFFRNGETMDLLLDELATLVEKLPVFFRTLRATPVDPESLDKLIDQIRST